MHGILRDPEVTRRWLAPRGKPESLRGHDHGQFDAHGDLGFSGRRAGRTVPCGPRSRYIVATSGQSNITRRWGRRSNLPAVKVQSPLKAGPALLPISGPQMPSLVGRRCSKPRDSAVSNDRVLDARSCDSSSGGIRATMKPLRICRVPAPLRVWAQLNVSPIHTNARDRARPSTAPRGHSGSTPP